MENRRFEDKKEPEIVYSKSVKAGKRLYYLDVKKARNEDLYLCITESKKFNNGEDAAPTFEKHKVFLYKEDFSHFLEALNDVVAYVKENVGEIEDREEWTPRDNQDAPNEHKSVAAEAPKAEAPQTETHQADDHHAENSSEESVVDKLKKNSLFGRFIQ